MSCLQVVVDAEYTAGRDFVLRASARDRVRCRPRIAACHAGLDLFGDPTRDIQANTWAAIVVLGVVDYPVFFPAVAKQDRVAFLELEILHALLFERFAHVVHVGDFASFHCLDTAGAGEVD